MFSRLDKSFLRRHDTFLWILSLLTPYNHWLFCLSALGNWLNYATFAVPADVCCPSSAGVQVSFILNCQVAVYLLLYYVLVRLCQKILVFLGDVLAFKFCFVWMGIRSVLLLFLINASLIFCGKFAESCF
jgi:hypothetical protein